MAVGMERLYVSSPHRPLAPPARARSANKGGAQILLYSRKSNPRKASRLTRNEKIMPHIDWRLIACRPPLLAMLCLAAGCSHRQEPATSLDATALRYDYSGLARLD